MRIGIDIRTLQQSSLTTGIGVMTCSLITALSKIDRGNEYYLLTIKGKKLPELELAEGFRYQYVPVPAPPLSYAGVITDLFTLPRIFSRLALDVLHVPSPFELKNNFDLGKYNSRVVLTIHDFIPLIFPDRVLTLKRQLLQPVFRYLVKEIPKAGHLIANSEFTKTDITKYAGVPPEKITTTLLGKDESFRVIDDAAYLGEARDRLNLPERFILYVGGFVYHKNVPRLLEAMELLKKDYGESTPLVLAGKIDSLFQSELQDIIQKLDLQNRVFLTGVVSREDLVVLYNLATVFVFPSLYEGFGLPVIESLACGTPVACSGVTSLPEVGGESAVYFNPEDPDSIAAEVYRLLSNDELRVNLGQKGREWSQRFTWEKTAQKTIDVYSRMVSSKVP